MKPDFKTLMTNVKVIEACAFSRGKIGGNPAGVVLDAQNLSEEEMQKIAKIINFSETIFVRKKSTTEFDVRFFTPTTEVSMCGHATVAAGYCISKKKLTKETTFVFNTKSGIVPVAIDKDIVTFKMTPLRSVEKYIDIKEIINALGIEEKDIDKTLPIELVKLESNPDLVLPIKSLEIMKNITPNFEELDRVLNKFKIDGLNVFSFDTIEEESFIRMRCFFPTLGIDEDPATGTSNAILGFYFLKNGILKEGGEFVSEQGYELKKPCRIIVKVKDKNNISAGGTARITKEREIKT